MTIPAHLRKRIEQDAAKSEPVPVEPDEIIAYTEVLITKERIEWVAGEDPRVLNGSVFDVLVLGQRVTVVCNVHSRSGAGVQWHARPRDAVVADRRTRLAHDLGYALEVLTPEEVCEVIGETTERIDAYPVRGSFADGAR